MKRKSGKLFIVAALSAVLAVGPANACSWAAFVNGKAAFVVRTMDWISPDDPVVKGYGRSTPGRSADTPDGIEYRAKYASMQIHSFEIDVVAEAMNEKGLQGSILFLDESELPARLPGRGDVDPNRFLSYAISNFATVKEVVDDLSRINFIPASLDLPDGEGGRIQYPPEKWPGHFAFVDPSGDKVVIEFIGGEVKVYHGPEHDALTNEPFYDVHLAREASGYVPNGTISTVDRRLRARLVLKDMRTRGVDSSPRALLAMRGVLAAVFAGTEEIDPEWDEIYPTLWSVIGDLNGGTYYFSSVFSWCGGVYDFAMFDADKPEATVLTAESRPRAGLPD